jgi:SLT domain-containing protein
VNTAQLAAAEAQLAGARAAQSKASTAYHKAQQNEITKNQMAARQAFIDLKNTAVQSLTQIGAPMAPVMKHIADTARGVLQKLTPVFKIVVADIAGPFQTFVDTILKAFQDPATQAAIEAVAGAFVDVLKAFTPDIKGIMDSFSDAIRRIADSVAKNPKAFADFLNFVFQLGIMLLNAVAYLSDFASYIEQHFIPAVHHVINFFKGIGINLGKFWHAVIDNFKQSIGIIIDILKFFRDIWTGHWSAAGHDIVDIGKRFWRIIVNDFKVIIPDLLRLMGYLGSHLVSIAKGAFDHLWWLILNIGDRGRHSVANQWDQFRHDMATIATHIWHDITGFFSLMWHQILGDFDTFNRAYLGALNKFKNMVLGFFRDAINWLSSAGSSVIHGMLNGIDNAMKDIGNWVKKHIVNPIVNWVKHHFGIASPSTVMMGLGVNLIEGLLRGLMKNSGNVGKIVLKIFGSIPNALGAIVGKGLIALEKLPASAIKLLGSVGGKIGGFFSHLFHGGPAGQGVMRWADLVKVALMLNNLPDSLAGRVLYQMQTESGGNPNAINLWDINAQRGDPSRGLMQVIGSTFAAYHVPGTSMNIYDPLANIAAAINYAKHVYGPGLGALGSGHGYAAGTGGATPGWAWVGERGPELVNFSGGETVIPAIRLGGYASGTLSAAEAIAAHNKALAEATAAAHRSQAMAIAAANKMANAGATLAARIAAITAKTTPATWTTDLRLFFKDLRLYFSPKTAEARSKLVQSQINQMKSLQTSITKMDANITNAIAFQKQQYSQLRAQTGIGTIGIQGVGAAGGRSILAGLQRNLSSARSFGLAIRDLSRAGASQAVLKTVAAMDPASGSVYARKMISALNKMHSMKLSPEMINQLVALGPDAALAYINAIQAGGPSLLKQVKSTEAALEAARVSTSRGITSVVSGGAYVTGVNFVAGLKSQQKALEKQFAHLGKVLGEEAIKWMGVPYSKRPRGYASGGWLNEPVTGYGLYSGATYTFAEHGREYVIPEGGPTRGGDGGTQYIAHFDGLTREAIESHVRTAFNAMALTQGALQRNGRRSL